MSDKHKHPHADGHHHEHSISPRWKPHRDWRFWTVILMLIGIVIYVLTLDESLVPGGGGREVPAVAAP